jgi:hypothetical protein
MATSFSLPVLKKLLRLHRLHFLRTNKIVTVTLLLVFDKSDRLRFFVTSRLLKVVLCNDCY